MIYRTISQPLTVSPLQRLTSVGMTYALQAQFQGGKAPYRLAGTRNCTTLPGFCCDGRANRGHTLDLDASHDGVTFVNATNATLDVDQGVVRFDVVGLPDVPKVEGYAVIPTPYTRNTETQTPTLSNTRTHARTHQ